MSRYLAHDDEVIDGWASDEDDYSEESWSESNEPVRTLDDVDAELANKRATAPAVLAPRAALTDTCMQKPKKKTKPKRVRALRPTAAADTRISVVRIGRPAALAGDHQAALCTTNKRGEVCMASNRGGLLFTAEGER